MSEVVDLANDSDEDEHLQRALKASMPEIVDIFIHTIDSDDESTPKRKRKRTRINDSHPPIDLTITQKPECWNEVIVLSNVEERKLPAIKPAPAVRTPILQLYEVFPDVEEIHAKSLLMNNGNEVATVLSILAENGYPKSKTNGTAFRDGVTILKRDESATAWKHDFMSPSSFEPTVQYAKESAQQLTNDFPFLSKVGAKNYLLDKGKYAICHEFVCQKLTGQSGAAPNDEEAQYKNYTTVMTAKGGGALDDAQQGRFLSPSESKYIIKRTRKAATKFLATEPILVEEIQYVQSKWNALATRMEAYKARMDTRVAAERTNSTMDCLCCYTAVAIDEMIQCQKEGHLFCIDCIRRFAETQVFGAGSLGINRETKEPATELMCMFADGCSSGFCITSLQKALPEKTLAKYNDIQYQIAIAKAGMENLVSCPKCEFQAELPPTEMIFRCPVLECGFASCRKCGEESHIPLRCEEVEKRVETMGRLRVEEAISNAKIRACPRPSCKNKFVKEHGCNKMTCPCGALVCYICRKEIDKQIGYQHFCQTALCDHKTCKKCILHSNTQQDDELAMREAGIKAAEEVREETLSQPNSSAEVRVNVDTMMKNPARSRGGRGPLLAAFRQFQIQYDQDRARIGVQGIVARHKALAGAGRPNLAG